jgi:hypothetical protein
MIPSENPFNQYQSLTATKVIQKLQPDNSVRLSIKETGRQIEGNKKEAPSKRL